MCRGLAAVGGLGRWGVDRGGGGSPVGGQGVVLRCSVAALGLMVGQQALLPVQQLLGWHMHRLGGTVLDGHLPGGLHNG